MLHYKKKKKNLHYKYCNLPCRKFKFTMAFLKAIGSFAMATASLLFVMLEVESGLSGGEESISRGPSLSLTSVGVCRAWSFEGKIQDIKFMLTIVKQSIQKLITFDTLHFPYLKSYRALNSPLLLLVCFAKILLEGASQFTKQTHLLTILKKPGGSGCLICTHTHTVLASFFQIYINI